MRLIEALKEMILSVIPETMKSTKDIKVVEI